MSAQQLVRQFQYSVYGLGNRTQEAMEPENSRLNPGRSGEAFGSFRWVKMVLVWQILMMKFLLS